MLRIRIALRVLWVALLVTWRRFWHGPRHPQQSWRAEVVVEFVRRGVASYADLPIAKARTRMIEFASRAITRQLDIRRDARVAGRPAEVHTPRGWQPGGPVVLYLHGGAYVTCSPGTHRELVARIALAASARAVALDYRLAPEHPYPAALDDAVAAYTELAAEHGPASLVVAGDSAGGGLALATLVRVRDEGATLCAGGVLLSPWVDLACTGASLRDAAETCYVIGASAPEYAAMYMGDCDARHPLVSPLYARLEGLPPLLVQVGGAEALRSEGEDLVARARRAGVDVSLRVEPGMFHVYQAAASVVPEARPSIAEIGAFVRAHTAPAATQEPDAPVESAPLTASAH